MHLSTLQWLSLIAAIWLQSINGSNSDFPAYSNQLKHLLSMSQLQLNNLAFASDAGKLFGCFSGFAAAHLPLWLVLMLGSTLGLIGYGVQFLFITNKISSLSYWQIFMLCALAGNSICWINTVCYIVNIRNFPSNPGVAVGISTSYQGLTAKLYTDIVNAFAPFPQMKRAKAYLLLNSVAPVIVSVVTAPLVRGIDPGKAKATGGEFMVMFLITITTGIFAVIGSLSLTSRWLSPSIQVIGMGLLLAAPLAIPVVSFIKEGLEEKWWIKREIRVHDLTIEEVDTRSGLEIEVKEEDRVEEESQVAVTEATGVRLMLKSVEFWLYFFVYMFGATLGLVFLNNLGQIAESRGHAKTSDLVSLSSSFGFFGRLMPSIFDYFFSETKYMVTRPASIAILMAPMAGSFFLLVNKTSLFLYISTAIIGVCTGAITSIAVSTTSELFGMRKFSMNHNIVVANIPVGSLIFGYLAAIVYRREGNGEGRCMGVECYRKTFILWGSICLFGTLLAFILYARTRKFYSQLRRS